MAEQEYEDILKTIPTVVIDKSGKVFKYILVEVSLKYSRKMCVRGFAHCDYHADIFDDFKESLKKINSFISLKCMGGGRIDHQAEKILIYGYSVGYGRANHETTGKLIQTMDKYKDIKIDWTNDGY